MYMVWLCGNDKKGKKRLELITKPVKKQADHSVEMRAGLGL
jgi:hypothetical protein